jgi:DNA-binding transcriptional MerR regulator
MAAPRDPATLSGIGEVSQQTGIPQHVLRYWETRLPQLQPVKRAGGRRYYRAEDVALIRTVQRLTEREGYTLDGAARALQRRDRSSSLHAAPASPSMDGNHAVRTSLVAIRQRLARALNANG